MASITNDERLKSIMNYDTPYAYQDFPDIYDPGDFTHAGEDE